MLLAGQPPLGKRKKKPKARCRNTCTHTCSLWHSAAKIRSYDRGRMYMCCVCTCVRFAEDPAHSKETKYTLSHRLTDCTK